MNIKQLRASLVILALGIISSTTPVEAGSARKIGTAGAPELLIPVGARGSAMSGSMIAAAEGLEGIYWNPSGLATMEGSQAMFSHQPYLADMDVNFFGIGTNVESFGHIAFSAKILSIGDIEVTTEESPEGTGATFSPTMSVLSFTYATNVTAAVAFGATLMYVNESVLDVTASGAALDLGVTYSPNKYGLTFAFVIKNIGPRLEYSGVGFERQTLFGSDSRRVSANSAPFELPSSVNIGMAWRFIQTDQNVAMFTGNFRSNNFQEDFWQGGLEYAINDRWFLRGGYTATGQKDFLYGPSLGAGLVYPLGNTKVTLEYAWNQTDVFDDNQFLTMKIDF